MDRSGSLIWEFVYDLGGNDRITSFINFLMEAYMPLENLTIQALIGDL